MRAIVFSAALCAACPALADAPRVVADIPPVHALAARVMQGVGAPDLILPPGASPHGYAMTPSQAQLLDQADVAFWIGEALTPWLEGPLETLAGDARVVELIDAQGLETLKLREDARFEAHDHGHHGHGEHGHDEHAHDDHGHDDHDHDAHKDHDHKDDHHDDGDHAKDDHAKEEHAHDHGHDDHHDHHGGLDEHVWLDPANAVAMMDAMAAALAEADPANAAAYRANAQAGRAELDALQATLAAKLKPIQGKSYIVFHDAYQYFENRFGLSAAGAVSMGDARKPSAARLAKVRALVAEVGATCIFTEPQFPPKLAKTVAEGSGAKIASLDPLGAALTPGAALYPALLEGLASNLTDCLGAQ